MFHVFVDRTIKEVNKRIKRNGERLKNKEGAKLEIRQLLDEDETLLTTEMDGR